MQSPPSIRIFEQAYLASLALYLFGTVMYWSDTQATLAAMPQLQANPAFGSFVSAMMIGMVVIIAGLSVLFWWLVARRRSVVGKWLVVGTEGVGLVLAAFTLLALANGGGGPNVSGTIMNLMATALAVFAAAMLFRADAVAWLGERLETRP